MTDPWGVVPVSGRGSLPFSLVHGESLVATASFALQAAGVELVDVSLGFGAVRAAAAGGRGLVLHDPLCPLTPPGFLAEAVALSAERAAVVVGCRPVTDTVKEYAVPAEGATGPAQVGATVDRDALVQVTSPVVLPAPVVAGLTDWPVDLVALVDRARTHWPLLLLEAPASGRRVVVEDDLLLLEALTART